MGGFHIALNYLAVLGKMFDNCGLEDLLVESGVYASGTIAELLKGKQYNRGVRAHKLVAEAMFRLKWTEFCSWLKDANNEPAQHEVIRALIVDLQTDIVEKSELSNSLETLSSVMTPLIEQFREFETEGHAASQLFSFWDIYLEMVNMLLHFIRAERSGNWLLHLTATAGMTPYFYAMDRMNYSRWLPIYLADMNQLPERHPEVYDKFVNGNHAVE